ncbi:MAG: hypothetical protein M3388_05380, partial [Acidobacteriota bacterium]|nr:hypothetical protein [Acidobacteriota bacterium]
PAEVQAIVGTYTGAWTLYGINDKGEVIKQLAYTDVMKAENPTAATDRVFVSTMDVMTFEGGKIPPKNVPGKEGYLLNKDGSLGDYYIETYGQTIRFQKLDKDSWIYSTPAVGREFPALGDKFLSDSHVFVKTVTSEQGIETHHNMRLTTVRWTGADGKEMAKQFVSLQGQHKKSK